MDDRGRHYFDLLVTRVHDENRVLADRLAGLMIGSSFLLVGFVTVAESDHPGASWFATVILCVGLLWAIVTALALYVSGAVLGVLRSEARDVARSLYAALDTPEVRRAREHGQEFDPLVDPAQHLRWYGRWIRGDRTDVSLAAPVFLMFVWVVGALWLYSVPPFA